MTGNYEKLIHDNLDRLYKNLPKDLGLILPANRKGDSFFFEAFGEECLIRPEGINLGGREEAGVPGVLISLYVLNVGPEPSVLQPLKAFKDFPGSMPYIGAFASYTEKILVPYVEKIEEEQNSIMEYMQGKNAYVLTKIFPLRLPVFFQITLKTFYRWTHWQMWENIPQRKLFKFWLELIRFFKCGKFAGIDDRLYKNYEYKHNIYSGNSTGIAGKSIWGNRAG